MARIENLTNFLTDVATAIKNKKGDNTNIKASDFDVEINNLSSGGSTPKVGFVVDEYDSDGYATEVTIYGMTTLPNYAFASYSGYNNFLNKKLIEVTLPENLTSIGQRAFSLCSSLTKINLPKTLTMINNYAFNSCVLLTDINLPEGLTTIGQYSFSNCEKLTLTSLPTSITSINAYAFQSCSALALKKLPDQLISLGNYAFGSCSSLEIKNIPDNMISLGQAVFQNCYGLKQVSMSKIQSITGNSSANNTFNGCSNLKAVWIGSLITSSGLGRYSFYGCSSLEKIFIDLPRTTVETFTNYTFSFMDDTSKTRIIICNDDENFITKEEFDAIDWVTYTE